MRFISIFIAITLLFTGCKKNKYIIPEKAFKNILIELHLADGIYMMNYGKYNIHTDSLNFYNTIFKSYGYSRAQFDSTLKYYSVKPHEFDKIYDYVVTELNILEEQMNQLKVFEEDSTNNLFPLKKRWNIYSNYKSGRIPFDISIADSAEYSIYVYAKKFPDDQSKNLRISAYFWYTDSITKKWKKEELPEVKYSSGKDYNLFSCSKVYSYKKKGRLRGWILNHDDQDKSFKKHVDVKLIFIEKKLLLKKR
jgi:hypothetical protein